jgi:hypothetical protein
VTGTVHALVIDEADGDVFIGGAFSSVDGSSRNGVAEVTAAQGAITTWDAGIGGTAVYTLALSGSTLYVGGNFSTVNGGATTRNNIAAFDTSSPTALSWDPNVNGEVDWIAVTDFGGTGTGPGLTVYAGGAFTEVNVNGLVGTGRNNIAQFDSTTAKATNFAPVVGGQVLTIQPTAGGVLVGGSFQSAGDTTVRRDNFAAIDRSSGTPTSWDPSPNGNVQTLVLAGSTLYVGGDFTTFASETKDGLAAVATPSNSVTPWNPIVNGEVLTILPIGSDIWVGGSFSTADGVTRNNAADFNTTSGAVKPWNPDLDGEVVSLAIGHDTGWIYAGGNFSTVNSGTTPTTRNNLAAFAPDTGTVEPWNPDADGEVDALTTFGGSTIYAGGQFTHANVGNDPVTRNYAAAFDETTGVANSWNPNMNSFVFALSTSPVTVLAGGDFTAVGGTPIDSLAALDPTTGAPSTWNPAVDIDIFTLTADNNNGVYAGGDFTTVNNGATSQAGFAHFSYLLPTKPASVTATPGDGSATVSFTPSDANGLAPVTSYTVTASPGGETATGSGSPITVTGLSDGTSYTFTVSASSWKGTTTSDPSNAVTPAAPDFSIAVSPTTQSVAQGQAATFTVTTTTSGGFSSHLNYSVISAPTASTTSFATGPPLTATVTTAASTPANIYTLTILATNDAHTITRTASAQLVVTAASNGGGGGGGGGGGSSSLIFTVTPSSQTAGSGGSAPVTVTLTNTGGAYLANVNVSGPSGCGIPASSSDTANLLPPSVTISYSCQISGTATFTATAATVVATTLTQSATVSVTAASSPVSSAPTVTHTPTPTPAPTHSEASAATVTAVTVKTIQLPGGHEELTTTLHITKAGTVKITLMSSKGKKLASWSEKTKKGASSFKLKLAGKLSHSGHDVLVIRDPAGHITKKTLTLR